MPEPVERPLPPPTSSGRCAIRVRSRSEALSGHPPQDLDDPEGLALLEGPKREALATNPLATSEADPIQLLGLQGSRVIGRLDLVAGRVRAWGEELPVQYTSGLLVPAEYRQTMMGLMLIMKAQGLCQSLGAFGPSQIAKQVYDGLKWRDLPLRRYISLFRAQPVIHRYIHSRAGRPLMTGLANTVLSARSGLLSALTSLRAGQLDIDREPRMETSFDPLIQEAIQAPIACHRSAGWINWLLGSRFKDDPRDRQDLWIVSRSGGRPLAYFLTKVRFHESATHRGFPNLLLGSLQDWVILDPSALDARHVVLSALRVLRRQGVDAAEVCTGDRSLGAFLLRTGCLPAGTLHMMFKGAPSSPLARLEAQSPSNWFVRPCDGEAFFS